MRKVVLGVLLCGAVVLAILPSSANAACAPADLGGVWDAYTVGAQDGVGYWNRCSISFSSAARFLSGSSCRSSSGATSSLSGRLVVSSNCRVSGSFTQRFSAGSVRCNIPQATLSRDKEVVTGVGQCDGGAAVFSFNMAKR